MEIKIRSKGGTPSADFILSWIHCASHHSKRIDKNTIDDHAEMQMVATGQASLAGKAEQVPIFIFYSILFESAIHS